MLNQATAQVVLEAALSTGGDFAEIFMEDRRNNSLILQDNRLETINSGRIHGAGVRVYKELSAYYAYTNDTSREGLIRCALEAASAVKAGDERAQCAKLVAKEIRNAHYVAMKPSETDTKLKADILRAANNSARAVSEEITQVTCGYRDSEPMRTSS